MPATRKRPAPRRGRRRPSPVFSLRITAETALPAIDPDDDIVRFLVDIVPHDEAPQPPVGRIEVLRFNIAAFTDRLGWETFHLFDAASMEAAELYETLFDEAGELRPELGVEMPAGSDILFFSEADLPRKLRGSKLVLAAVARTIQALGGGCSVAAISPWDRSITQAAWTSIGFRKLPRSRLLFRDLALQVPGLESLLR